ncbi:MAG TPA: FG-GAP-like repeat-containing protein [Thermoanaerobaculia bacterium]|nr:FG-GAP-like repeat-containing protein [Thermoanaerobaculia bacterium]
MHDPTRPLRHSLAAPVRFLLGWALVGSLGSTTLHGQLTAEGSQVWRSGAPPTALLGLGLSGDETGKVLASGDFDGDGWDDLAIGTLDAVHVVYGSETGLDPARVERWSGPESLGESLAVGDFDGDGFDDLAIGAPGATVSAAIDAGMVVVLYGSGAGLVAVGQQHWHQGVAGIADHAEAGDVFGFSLTSGDFDGDGFADLAVGIPGEDVFGSMDAGAVQVIYGGPSGLSAAGSQFLNRGDAAPPVLEAEDGFGHALAAGDFDGDGFDELAVAIPLDSTIETWAGSVQIFFGTGGGLVGSRTPSGGGLPQGQNWRQGSAIGETIHGFERFGWSLAVGDFDGDGFADLVVGVPFEYFGFLDSGLIGAVHVIYGSSSGLTGAGSTLLEGDDFEDRFGWSLAAGDFDGDGFDELAVGSPTRILGGVDGAGEVKVYRGSEYGIDHADPQLWNQDSAGIADQVELNDQFGAALASGRFSATGQGLAIGAPCEDSCVGQVHVLYPEEPLVADFDWAPGIATAGLPVQFTDTSTGGPTAWSWDFGDGGISMLQNPSHTFLAAGVYTVSLVASRGAVSDEVSRQVTVVESGAGTTVRFELASLTTGEGVEVAVRVLKSGGAGGQVRVAVVGGSATPGLDFVFPNDATLTWQAGDASARELVLEVLDDDLPELTETIELALVEASGFGLASPASMTVRILDDDLAPPEEIVIPATAPAEAIVADDGTGLRAVVWVEEGGLSRVVAQMLGPSGAALTEAFLVGFGSGHESAPAATWTGEGKLLVAWQESAQPAALFGAPARVAASSILGRVFDPSSLPDGPPVELGQSEGTDARPDVGADGAGGGVVTWQDGERPRGRRVRRGGQPEGDSFALLEQGGAEGLQVAKAPTGDFVAVWRALGASGAASASMILGRVFDPQGRAKGTTFPIAENAEGRPAVDTDDTGGFVVTWESGPSGARRIFGRRHGAQGQPLGPAFPISAGDGDARAPRVDVNAAGDFVVVWQSDATAEPGAAVAAGSTILGRFFTGGLPSGEEVVVAETEADSEPELPDVSLSDADQATVVYTRRGGGGRRLASTTIEPALARGVCGDQPTELCLQQARFGLRVSWADGDQQTGLGQPVALTSDTGYFWFFAPSNVELVVKVLDGCAINGHFWVFVGGLTDVGVSMVVDDVASGVSRSYFKAAGESFEPILDTAAFATCDVPFAAATRSHDSATALREAAALVRAVAAGGAAACSATDQALCLNRQRFLVEAEWRSDTASGTASAIGLTDDTGYFWFFGPTNVELVVKVLDGCSITDRYWVFGGGLTDTEVRLTITDSDTGTVRVYDNTLGRPFAPIRDTGAFATCP